MRHKWSHFLLVSEFQALITGDQTYDSSIGIRIETESGVLGTLLGHLSDPVNLELVISTSSIALLQLFTCTTSA